MCEHALDYLLTAAIDLSSFADRFKNDTTGAPATPPKVLLQVETFAYSRGLVIGQAIACACGEHVTFIALCGDTRPHFTTIAHVVRTRGADIAPVFAAVLIVCGRQRLRAHEMFAIEGVKLPSNASTQRRGKRDDFERQSTKPEAAMTTLRDAERLRAWLATHSQDRRSATVAVRKSNRTDNESAGMATSKGFIQGYTGVAAVDMARQILVVAQAHGTGSEQELLVPIVEATCASATNASRRKRASTHQRDARRMGDALPRWNRCSALYGRTSGSIALRCAA